jgi:hypothetical protein
MATCGEIPRVTARAPEPEAGAAKRPERTSSPPSLTHPLPPKRKPISCSSESKTSFEFHWVANFQSEYTIFQQDCCSATSSLRTFNIVMMYLIAQAHFDSSKILSRSLSPFLYSLGSAFSPVGCSPDVLDLAPAHIRKSSLRSLRYVLAPLIVRVGGSACE